MTSFMEVKHTHQSKFHLKREVSNLFDKIGHVNSKKCNIVILITVQKLLAESILLLLLIFIGFTKIPEVILFQCFQILSHFSG